MSIHQEARIENARNKRLNMRRVDWRLRRWYTVIRCSKEITCSFSKKNGGFGLCFLKFIEQVISLQALIAGNAMGEADSGTIQNRFGGMGRMKISIVGIGYIGLPTAVMFASGGHQVVGMDLNRKAVDALNQGKIIIEEPHLDEAVAEAVKSGNLRASMTVEPADVYIICVPTPILPDHSADMRAVRSAAESLLSVLKKGDTVILESTSPPGTTRDLIVPILAG